MLSKNLLSNNNSFFHYTVQNLQKYIKHPQLDLIQRFNQFYIYWNNFNNQKRILQRYLTLNKPVEYPKIFKTQQRHIINKFTINFNYILTEINTLKLNNKEIPYSYIILIKKLITTILKEKVFPLIKIQFLNINVLENTIEVEINKNQIKKTYNFKLNKFIKKWQDKFPQLYKNCDAYLIVSSNYKDLLLQSTFKQWTSCLNLINTYIEYKIKYSCINNIRNGNLIAYCILDLHDNKSIDEIMDDISYHGLCYSRCFWRCSIKRLYNVKNLNEYLFIPQSTSYGTIMQNAISYNYKLFVYLNKYINQLNNTLSISFDDTEIYKTFKIMYPMYSDMFTYINKNNQYKLYLFNNNINNITLYKKKKLIEYAKYNIEVLTSDIIALLNVFKFFDENKIQLTKQQYINDIYFQKSSYILNNSYQLLNKLNYN